MNRERINEIIIRSALSQQLCYDRAFFMLIM